MSSEPTPSEMLTELGACAYRLGVAFSEQADAETVWSRKLELFQLFDRCFSGFRISVALGLRLRQEARRQDVAGEPAPASEPERAEREPPEHEPPERERMDYERDRETERASLPLLLKTLSGVATAADALPGPPPAELPTLRELLARIGAEARPGSRRDPRPNRDPTDAMPRSGAAPPGSAGGPGALRARLAGSAVIGLTRPPPPPSSSAAALAVPRRRPPTGPPHR